MRDVNHTEEWEQITAELAKKCGLQMAETKLIKGKDTCIFLTKRFDRVQDTRIHFASALTMLGKQDGEDAGFMDIANFIRTHTAQPREDLKELWRRIVFMIAVSNADCHLRNHGFLLQRDGWHLAPAYDINPNESGSSLALRIYRQDHSLDMGLAIQAASYYEIDSPKSEIEKIQTIIKTNYVQLTEKYHIPRKETIKMMRAFHLDISDLH
jgi:serine/threonine-protein kinase HipA